jgi:hypothetical protein
MENKNVFKILFLPRLKSYDSVINKMNFKPLHVVPSFSYGLRTEVTFWLQLGAVSWRSKMVVRVGNQNS